MLLVRLLLFLEKRSRRRKKECYLIANKSQFGWKTTKTYFDETFKNDSDDDDKDFWEMPDLKPDEKQSKFHKAEVEVKFQHNNQKLFVGNHFLTFSNSEFKWPF